MKVTLGGGVDHYDILSQDRFSPCAGVSVRLTDARPWNSSTGSYCQEPAFLFVSAFPRNSASCPGAAAWTGVNEKTLRTLGDEDFEKIYLFPNAHVWYYRGATMVGMKVIFRKSNGRLLGVQALGEDGPAVDKRISALAGAIQMGATVYDLEEAEVCYAPQFGSAKDPINFAGMVAGNLLRGDMPVSQAFPVTE